MSAIAKLTPRRLKLALVAMPLALAALYYAVFAANRYVSETIVTVRQANQQSNALPGAAMLLAGINPPSREDTLYLRQYIHSLDLLKRLDERLGIRAHFEGGTWDPFYRLHAWFPQEWFLWYWRNRVEVLLDDMSGLLTVRVEGFEPEFAQKLNAAILEESERFVNAFSHRIAREQMQFAETELERASERLQQAKRKLLAFQTSNRLLDPTAQAQASGSLTAELQATLARQEAELRNALTYLNENSYQVRALRSQIEAVRAQLEAERARATSARRGKEDRRLNALSAEFQGLQLQVGFAQDAYKLALGAVENARIEATRKLKSLVVIEPPSRPEMALYPRRIYNLITLLVVCALLYGIVRLVVATIRDHQD